jgi:SAM-dependent methyltransferase
LPLEKNEPPFWLREIHPFYQVPHMDPEIRRMHESNRSAWNEGARHYSDHLDETIAFLQDGNSNLHPIERRNLGDLSRFHLAVHLQCASGRDTLSLWREGVQHVIGIDISDVHISNARKISAALDAPADWYRCDIIDTPQELDGTADLVYTGRGAINWLHDLTAWAGVVSRLLKPGGVFHILDDHPMTWLVDAEASELRFSGIPYFNYSDSGKGWPETYIGDTIGIPVEEQSTKYEHLWTLADIVTSITRAGINIKLLGEHNEAYWDNFPNLNAQQKALIPLTFSLLAEKPQSC